MLSQSDLILGLGLATTLLLVIALVASVLASLKTHQVKQFQEHLFKAERKIDQLERRTFNILNAVPVALVETDLQGKFTFANRAAHLLLGRKDNELISLRFHSATWGITYPDGRQIPQDLLPASRALRGQTVKGFQHLLARQGSSEKVLVSVTSMPILNSAGEVIGSTSAMVELESHMGEGVGDLTGLWRGTWFTSALVPFYGLDGLGQILDLNPAGCEALNLRRDAALGQDFVTRFVEPSDQARARDYFNSMLSDDETLGLAEIPLRLKTLDGRTDSYVVSAWAVKASEGGEKGLTLMAIPAEGILPNADAVMDRLSHNALDTDRLARLNDLEMADAARADLGVGSWHYDADADAIVEDAAMQKLIGRAYEGGPTLIGEDDQKRADEAFSALLGGETDTLDLELKVTDTDMNERWIALKGKATVNERDQKRAIYGIAVSAHNLKMAPLMNEETMVSEPNSEMALQLEALEGERDALRAQLAQTESALHEAQSSLNEAQALAAPQVDMDHDEPNLMEQLAEISPLHRLLTKSGDRVVVAQQSAYWQSLNADLPPQSWAELIRDTDRAEVLETLSEAFRKPMPFELIFGITTAQGDKTVLERFVPLEEADHLVGFIGLGFEITPAPVQPTVVRLVDDEALETVRADLRQAEAIKTRLEAELFELRSRPEPEPKIETVVQTVADPEQARKIDELSFELNKYRAAFDEANSRISALESDLLTAASQPKVDMDAVNARLAALEAEAAEARKENQALKDTVTQLDEALSHASKYETVGRLTSDVAQDFAQMLSVVNNALEMMAQSPENPEQVRKLSEAALVAGKRGERLTRQLQAFNQADY